MKYCKLISHSQSKCQWHDKMILKLIVKNEAMIVEKLREEKLKTTYPVLTS